MNTGNYVLSREKIHIFYQIVKEVHEPKTDLKIPYLQYANDKISSQGLLLTEISVTVFKV